MKTNWQFVKDRLKEIEVELLLPELLQERRLELQKEHSRLSLLHGIYVKFDEVTNETHLLEQQLGNANDEEMAELIQTELHELYEKKKALQGELEDILYPADEHDQRSIFLEVRPGTGGQEAALFAADLLRMYTHYAEKKGWKANVQSLTQTDLGGIREAVLFIKGRDVYGHLKYEAGVHRVQRVPQTEASGRIHTSTATVAVMPEAKDVDVSINPADLRIDVFRASGAGGQHVNTTDSAVRITHIPTGIVVSCQDERSQHKNKAKALKALQAKLLAAEKAKKHSEMSAARKQQVGTGMRSEKVRTYNYPQNRITDHQVGLTLKRLDMVMEGDLEEIVQALRTQDREQRKSMYTSSC